MRYYVLLQKMTPVYTLVVEAAREEDAVGAGLGDGEGDFSHDRLPGNGVWSLIPPVDVFMPAEDGEPKVIGICGGEADTAKLSCVGGNLVCGDVPHFVVGTRETPLAAMLFEPSESTAASLAFLFEDEPSSAGTEVATV